MDATVERVKRTALAATASGWFLFSLDLTVVTVALPTIGIDFSAPLTLLQWVVTAYAVTVAALLLPAGRLGDHWGPRRVYLAGLIVFGCASVISALAPTLWVLVLGRAAQGVGGAAMTATGLALLSVSYGDDVAGRTRAIGWWAALGGVAGVLGLFVGGVVVSFAGWRPLFWVNIPIVVLAVWLTLRLPRQARGGAPPAVDVLQLVAVAAAVALLVTCLSILTWASTALLASLALVMVIAFGVVAWRQRASDHPSVPRSITGSANARRALIYALIANVQFYMALLALTVYFQTGLGWTAVLTGLAFLPAVLPTPIAMPIVARISAVVSPRRVLLALTLLGALGFAIMALSSTATPYALLAIGMVCVALACSGILIAPLTRLLMQGVAPGDAGAVTGVLTMMRQLGASVGAASLALVVAGIPVDAVSRAGWACLVLAAVCGLLLIPSRRERAPVTTAA